MQSDGGTIGELWVSYDARLRKPRLPRSLGDPSSTYIRLITQPPNSASDQLMLGTQAPYYTMTSDSNPLYFVPSVLNRSISVVVKKRGVYTLVFNNNSTFTSGTTTFSAGIGSNLQNGPSIFLGNQVYLDTVQSLVSAIFKYNYRYCFTVVADGIGAANTITVNPHSTLIYTAGNDDLTIWRMGATVPLLLQEVSPPPSPQTRVIDPNHIDGFVTGLESRLDEFHFLDDEKSS